MSQQAISRRLAVLERAGVISLERRAAARLSHLEAEPLREATAWLARYRESWDESYDRLDALFDALLAALQQPGEQDAGRTGAGPDPHGAPIMGATRITAEPGLPFIDIEREFAAPRELLFRAHVEPELISRWLGPAKYRTVVELMEVRDGGSWRFVHRAADGEEHGFRGVFHGEPSVEGITRTWEYEGWPGHVSLERVTFEERDGRTIVRAHAVHQSVEDRDGMVASGMEGGVNEGYARLDDLLARLAPAAWAADPAPPRARRAIHRHSSPSPARDITKERRVPEIATSARIRPCLWFADEAEEAAAFYSSIFPGSRITSVSRHGEEGREIHGRPPGSVWTIGFELDGQPFTALNGGPAFRFTEAISFQVACADQAEVDHYWDRLGEGGDPAAQQCGWLKDRFGVSWQVIPTRLYELIADPDPDRVRRATTAMLAMRKLDVAELERAADG